MEMCVLVVGELPAVAAHAFDLSVSGVSIERADTIAAGARLLADGPEREGLLPDLIVLAQQRPGEFATEAIDELRRRAPLARVWRLLGSWCEGEARSGQPPAGCTNTYWHQWPPRWQAAIDPASAGEARGWNLPITASSEERTIADCERPLAPGSGLIAICAPHAETAAALADACHLGGYDTLVVGEAQRWQAPGARAVLWDARPEALNDATAIRLLRDAAGGARLVALVGFPRPADYRRAAEHGVAAVISKPYLVHELLWQLAAVANPSRTTLPGRV